MLKYMIFKNDFDTLLLIGWQHSIFIQSFMKFVPEALIDNKLTPVLVMFWRRTGNKSLPKLTMT